MNGVAGDMGVLARELGGLFQSREVLRVYTKPNGSSPPRGSFDEAVSLQSFNHIVNRGRGDLEVAFQIRFRGSLAADLGVVVDKRQILTLLAVNDGRSDGSSFDARSMLTANASSPK